MQHIVTDVTHSMLCLLRTRLNRSRCGLGADLHGPQESCIRWESTTPMEMGNIWGLSGPLKNVGSLCYGVDSKRDHSILNNHTTCNVAIHRNSLTFYFCPLSIILCYGTTQWTKLAVQQPFCVCYVFTILCHTLTKLAHRMHIYVTRSLTILICL